MKSFKQHLVEHPFGNGPRSQIHPEEIPQYLYHSTMADRVDGIMAKGLLPSAADESPHMKGYISQREGVVYLAWSPIQTADNIRPYDTHLRIDTSDPSKFDKNALWSDVNREELNSPMRIAQIRANLPHGFNFYFEYITSEVDHEKAGKFPNIPPEIIDIVDADGNPIEG